MTTFISIRSAKILILMLIPFALLAQQGPRDVLYLKNGSIIKGYVLEQIPNKTVRIRTADGSIFVFQMDEVDRIVKEEYPQPMGTATVPSPSSSAGTVPQTSQAGGLVIMAGVSFPSGDIAATAGSKAGYAKIGYTLSLQYFAINDNSLFYGIGLAYSSNPFDESALRQALGASSSVSADVGSWTSFMPFVVLGFGGNSGDLNPFIGGLIGISFSSSPDISMSSGGVFISQPSASATSLCYGLLAGLRTAKNIQFVIRYLLATPKYNITATGGGYSASSEFEQPTNLVQAIVGVSL